MRLLPSLIAATTAVASANAGPESEVASAFDEDDGFDLHASLHYRFSSHSAVIARERTGEPGTDPDGLVNIENDLSYSSARHLIVPRLELGVFTDLSISLELPVVIRDTSKLDFAGGIDRQSSSTISDGLLSETGFDARDPNGPGFGSGGTIFRGTDRSGLDQLNVGLTWAPMNQARDATKPTWKVGAELRLAIGEPAAFNRVDPSAENGVGRGLHEVRLWTSVARRRGWAEVLFELWWMAAFIEKSNGQLAEPNPRFGAAVVAPQQQGGARAGLEATFFERPTEKQRVSLELAADFTTHFEGREYSEMWEVFAFAGDSTGGGPLVLDADPTTEDVQAISHPGVSNIQNYLTVGTKAGVRAELGPNVRIGATFGLDFDQSHFISFADAGEDLPLCNVGQASGCENDSNDVVDPGSQEVNPLHAPVVDIVGHRYKVAESRRLSLMVEGRFLF